MSSDPFVANPNGALNGGIVVAIADQGPGVLARRTSGPDHIGVTAALHIQYHQPVFAPFSVTVNRLPGGRRVQYYEIWFEDAQRGRVASAHATLVVTPVPALREIDDGPDAVPGVSDERNSEE
ncbi:PaaI family thioesterase [Gordonia rubripertincta]|uniref:PaaI family thioesterase n=1 Tax=Gordonia rubripertincta TaxID=36822 RepID=A0ABT4MW80_GORRU|nr:PaaI family thioesterase [Gordonia rubripertincta]MCZ4551064.1 PaaI family thioesterase [Gordonia rubripertincta]